MFKTMHFCIRVRNVALLLGLTAILPALAACPPDSFVDQANFSHVEDDPSADAGGDSGGYTVATNGQVVAYGMIGHPGHDTHHVYLYQRGASVGQWSFLKRLDQPGPGFTEPGDEFATTLAMDGDTLVVGAPRAGPDYYHETGAVYVYRRDAGGANTWGTTQSVFYDIAGSRFGESLDIHRDRMVVGASAAGGRAVVYERSSASADFTAVAELLPPAADLARIDGGFAYRVALYGDIAVVSDPAFLSTSIPPLHQGRVWVYARNQGGNGHWGLVTTLLSPPSTPPDGTLEFGYAISVWGSDDQTRGETIAVSNHHQAGHVFLFGRDAGGTDNWGQIVNLEPGDSGSKAFGESLHLHSNELLVGDPNASGLPPYTGAVYVYHQQTGGSNNWGQVQKLYSQDSSLKSYYYGTALDWSAGVAVIGDPWAPYDSDIRVGRAYVLFDDVIFCDPFE